MEERCTRVLAEEDNEIDKRTDEEFIHDQLNREPTEFVKGKSLLHNYN